MRVLVTAGPTREYIDPVRFLTNASTGAMGYALAAAARRAGHEVVLVSGPTALKPPTGVSVIPVVSARDMYREVLREFPRIDLVLMNAAVADYRPRRCRTAKRKKSPGPWQLELIANPDILWTLGRRRKHQRLMGFALETHQGLANARRKLQRKRLDWIVLNAPSAIGARRLDATLIPAGGPAVAMENLTKGQLARQLVKIATSTAAAPSR